MGCEFKNLNEYRLAIITKKALLEHSLEELLFFLLNDSVD